MNELSMIRLAHSRMNDLLREAEESRRARQARTAQAERAGSDSPRGTATLPRRRVRSLR